MLLEAACWAVYDEASASAEQGFLDTSVWEIEHLLILRLKTIPDAAIPESTGSRAGDALAVCSLVVHENLESPEWLISKMEQVVPAFVEDGFGISRRTLLEQSQKAVWLLLDFYRETSQKGDHFAPEGHHLNAPLEHTAFAVDLGRVCLPEGTDRYQAFEAVLRKVEAKFPIQVGALRKEPDFQWQSDYAVLSVLLQERRARETFDRAQATVLHQLNEGRGRNVNPQAWSACIAQAGALTWEDQAHIEFEMRRNGTLDPAFRCDNAYDARRLFISTLKQRLMDASGGDESALVPLQGIV